jgi:hypothetical protein
MLDAGLASEPAGGLEGNESARSAPTREAARDVEAEELSTNGAEEWSSRPVQGLPPLSAVAAAPSPCDSTAAPLRSSQQWHARDGPRARRALCTRERFGRGQPRRLLAPGLRVATRGQVPPGAAARLFTRAAQHNGPNTASTRQLNRVSLPHRVRETIRIRSRHSRRTLPTQRSACAFARGAAIGARITLIPSERKTRRSRP